MPTTIEATINPPLPTASVRSAERSQEDGCLRTLD